MLLNKKIGSLKIPRELNTVKNGTQHLLSDHFKFMFFFSQIDHNKAWITLKAITNLIKYCYI